MTEHGLHALRIVRDALDRAPAVRDQFVASCCGDDRQLLDRVDAMLHAIEHVLAHGPRTRDLGGQANTAEMGAAIAALV